MDICLLSRGDKLVPCLYQAPRSKRTSNVNNPASFVMFTCQLTSPRSIWTLVGSIRNRYIHASRTVRISDVLSIAVDFGPTLPRSSIN